MLRKLLLPLVFPVMALMVSQPANGADTAAGRKLAEQWCAKCHNIEIGAPFKLNPPSFAAIAAYRTSDVILGKVVAPSMHSGMPETLWTLQREDFDNLVAYITSLGAN